jgi:hypothetical protein
VIPPIIALLTVAPEIVPPVSVTVAAPSVPLTVVVVPLNVAFPLNVSVLLDVKVVNAPVDGLVAPTVELLIVLPVIVVPDNADVAALTTDKVEPSNDELENPELKSMSVACPYIVPPILTPTAAYAGIAKTTTRSKAKHNFLRIDLPPFSL